GSRPVTRAGALAFGAALTLPAYAPNFALLMAALVLLGMANGVVDVAMNAQAAAVQQSYGRPIMSRIHALYSFGGLVGAVIGGRIASRHVDPGPHLLGAGLLIASIAGAVAFSMLPASDDAVSDSPRLALPTRALATLSLLAFFVLFGEGAMMNWSAVYLRDVSGAGPGLAAAGFASFSLAMAFGRAVGDALNARFGAERVVRGGGALAAVGMLAAVLVTAPWAVVVGFGAVGAGLSSVFPIVLSAAARRPGQVPGAAIAAVSVCGYSGLLAGPPLIGAVATPFNLRAGIGLVAATSVGVVLLASAVRDARPQVESGESDARSTRPSVFSALDTDGR
nr:MFS transporter [Gemmatimonadota bacterium]